jgi:hypothetical protein
MAAIPTRKPTPTRKPPVPPKLPSKDQAAAVIVQAKSKEAQGGDPVEELRSHLTDAQDAIGQALDLLDGRESEEQGEGE